MSKKPENIKKIMARYKLVKPVSKEVQDMMLARKRSDFRRILKRSGEYGFLVGLGALVFFFLKKLGISISFIKSVVISAIIIVIVTVSVITGGYLAVVKYVIPQFKEEFPEQIIPKENSYPNEKRENDEAVNVVKEKSAVQKPVINKELTIIALKPFTAGSGNKALARNISKKIAAIIKSKNKKIALVTFNKNIQKNCGLILLGTIDKLNEMIIINAKLVNRRSSKIIFYDSVIAQDEADLDSACKKIAGAIAGKVLQ